MNRALGAKWAKLYPDATQFAVNDSLIRVKRREVYVKPRNSRTIQRLTTIRVFAGLRRPAVGATNYRSGRLIAGHLALTCALGHSGISRFKREGDGATPAGRFRLLYGYYRADGRKRPVSDILFRAVRTDDGWCDDPASPLYNRPVRLPFAGNHETLWRDDGQYGYVIVIDYNFHPRQRPRGSAIFFHIAQDGYLPTAGCIAISIADMRRLLPRLARHTNIIIQ